VPRLPGYRTARTRSGVSVASNGHDTIKVRKNICASWHTRSVEVATMGDPGNEATINSQDKERIGSFPLHGTAQ